MVERRRVQNVVYYEYTSATIDYHVELDAFVVARADIYATAQPHRLTLLVVGTDDDIGSERHAIEDAIARSRLVLARLIDEHRPLADTLTANMFWTFNMAGQRLH
jgi:hypothetical protein